MSTASFNFGISRLIGVLLVAASTVLGQVEGPNGHYYQVVMEPGLLWDEAKAKAAESTFNGVHGYLATITSAEEDQFIENLRQQAAPGGYGSLWVGGAQLGTGTSPTAGWFWVNAEGPIPTRDGGEGYSNWQPTEPNDYNGPQSETYLSVGHFNNFGWNDESNSRHIHGYVVEYPSAGRTATVSIRASDPIAVENAGQNPMPDQTAVDRAAFTFSRTGDLSLGLPVYFSIHGTAVNGADYNEISKSIMIPAGQSEVRLEITPRPDALTVVEPMETVGIRIEPSLILTPTASYEIDHERREAAIVIYENGSLQQPAVDIAVPRDGFSYQLGAPITVIAAVDHSSQPVSKVEFFADDFAFGTVTPKEETVGLDFFRFTWTSAPLGSYDFKVRVTLGSGAQITSKVSRVNVANPHDVPKVAIKFVETAAASAEPWPDADFAPGHLEVTRTGSTAGNLQVFLSIGGTATADIDYERLQNYVVIAAGKTTARFLVVAKDDLIDEPNETVVVTLMPVPPNTDPVEGGLYEIDPDHSSAEVIILDNDDTSDFPELSIAAVTPHTSEPSPSGIVAPGLFRIFRKGATGQTLNVAMQYDGTAIAETDYRRLPATVIIPAGVSEMDLSVEPLEDNNVEGAETVIAAFLPIRGSNYNVDQERQRATVIIHDQEPGVHSSIVITAPQTGEAFRAGTTIRINATAIDPNSYLGAVEFYANETEIGESVIQFIDAPEPGTPVRHSFAWANVPAGLYSLTARGVDSKGHLVVSRPVRIQVDLGSDAPVISITASPEEIQEPSPIGPAVIFPSEVTISRTGDFTRPQRVYLQYEGSATPGVDFQPAPEEVVIPQGQASVKFLLSAKMDAVVEGAETIIVRIGPPNFPLNPDEANRIYEINSEKRAARIDILDGTDAGTTTVSIRTITESTREPRPQEDVAPAVFVLRRTGPTTHSLPVLLSYSGTASESDFNNPGKMFSFSAGQSELRVELYANDDDLVEGNETVVVSLNSGDAAAPPPYQIDPEHHSITLIIRDNDTSTQPNLVSIESTDPTATEFPPTVDAIDPARFYLSRHVGGDWSQPLQVFLSIHGTAKNGEDYETLPTSFTIPAGKGFVWIDLIPRADNNGGFNKYEIVSASGISWAEARRQAEESIFEGAHGYLATLTTAEEDAHVESLRLEVGSGGAYWVGGYQEAGEPSITENWKWVNNEGPIPGTNEGPGYANWIPTEPNDYWGPSSENHMVIGWLNTFGWNDQGENVGAQGYVVEYSVATGVAAEIMESVALRIEPSPAAGPTPAYEISEHSGAAIAVIFEHRAPSDGAIEVAFPSANFTYSDSADVDFFVAAYHPTVEIAQVDFYVDGQKVGSSDISAENEDPEGGFERHSFRWAQATPGRHTLHALATVNGQTLSTTQIPFIVEQVGGGDTVVSVVAADPQATEFPPTADGFDPARFLISRTGSLTEDLQVFFSEHGTAINGEDYERISSPVTIPAGKSSVAIQIVPQADRGRMTHKYEVVSEPGLSWEQARAKAEQAVYLGVSGHLATITSADEDAQIEELRLNAGGADLWVGGYQEPGEPSITEGWKWVNNEGPIPGSNDATFGYANWREGEPNDYWGPGSENHMVIGWGGPGWNDQGGGINAQGYVVEFDIATPAPANDEIMETVAIRLEPSPLMGPMPAYKIDPENRMAAAVIFEHHEPADGAVEVAFPSAGHVYAQRDNVEFLVAAFHPSNMIGDVDFYVDGQKVGTSSLVLPAVAIGGVTEHFFKWPSATSGRHVLQARATASGGKTLVSSEITFVVENDGANQNPTVRITEPNDGASFIEGQPIAFLVEAFDTDGTISKIDLIIAENGNQVVASADGPTLRFTINDLSVGAHTFFARAFDNFEALGISPAVRILVRHRDAVSFVHRNLPETYSPGAAFVVELRAAPPGGAYAYAVEDRPPRGWQVSNISHDGAFDSVNGKVKFGPFTDDENRTLTYRLTPPSSANGRYEFTGNSSLNGALYPVTGDDVIGMVQQFHPADVNQNLIIPLAEVTSYAAAWKSGQSWPTGPVPIPLNYVTRAHHIWQRGEAYRFDPAQGPAPACWVPSNIEPRMFAAGAAGSVQRAVSGNFQSGAATQVQITAAPASGTTSYALEERPPRGWTVSNISHEGTFDAASGTIRWGVFADAAARTFSYTLTTPPEVASVGAFTGQFSANGQLAEIGAANSLTINGAAPIEITDYQRTTTGVTLTISGPAGQTAVIEASADFTNWTELKSIFIPDGNVQFTDETAAANGHRFFRLRVQ